MSRSNPEQPSELCKTSESESQAVLRVTDPRSVQGSSRRESAQTSPALPESQSGLTSAATEKETISLNEQRLGSVLAALKASGAARVLDLGCGEGRLLQMLLKKMGCEVADDVVSGCPTERGSVTRSNVRDPESQVLQSDSNLSASLRLAESRSEGADLRPLLHHPDGRKLIFLGDQVDRGTATENLERLRARGLSTKRSLALREFALGIEALERFVRKEPLRRVREAVFGVLALESEPVDPRL